MMTFLGVAAIVLFFAVLFLLIKVAEYNRPKCPRCGKKMHYNGTDESDREVWVCDECGEVLMI